MCPTKPSTREKNRSIIAAAASGAAGGAPKRKRPRHRVVAKAYLASIKPSEYNDFDPNYLLYIYI